MNVIFQGGSFYQYLSAFWRYIENSFGSSIVPFLIYARKMFTQKLTKPFQNPSIYRYLHLQVNGVQYRQTSSDISILAVHEYIKDIYFLVPGIRNNNLKHCGNARLPRWGRSYQVMKDESS